jgi:proline dehydrogenase
VANTYTYHFKAACPSNGERIDYTLAITTGATIMVEDIKAECDVDQTYHEDLADKLFAKFGGRQVMVATHHGVHIQTTRGDFPCIR